MSILRLNTFVYPQVAACSAAAEITGVKRVSVVAGAEQVLAKRGRVASSGAPLNQTTSRYMHQDTMIQYNMSCRRAYFGTKHVSLNPDGLRAGRKESFMSAYWSVEAGLGSWYAPQDIC